MRVLILRLKERLSLFIANIPKESFITSLTSLKDLTCDISSFFNQNFERFRDRDFLIVQQESGQIVKQSYAQCFLLIQKIQQELKSSLKKNQLALDQHYFIQIDAAAANDLIILAQLAFFQLGHGVLIRNTQRPQKMIDDENLHLPAHLKVTLSPKVEIIDFHADQSKKTNDKDKDQNKDIVSIVMTSGSQGAAKGVALSFQNLLASALGTNQFYQLKADDCWALTLPAEHIGAQMIWMRSFLAGASVFIPTDHSWRKCFETSHPVDIFSLVPTQLDVILKNENYIKKAQAARAMIISGAHIPSSLVARAQEFQLNISLSYGLSEMAAQVCATELKESSNPHLAQSCGRPLKYRQIALNNAKEDSGQLKLAGETLFCGYYIDKKISPSRIKGKWFLSQDIASINKDGSLTILSRSDDIFISGGENINPREIEQFFLKHLESFPLQIQLDVYPQQDAKWGHVPTMAIHINGDGQGLSRPLLYSQQMLREIELANNQLPAHMKVRSFFLTPSSFLKKNLLKIPQQEKQKGLQQFHFLNQLPLKVHSIGDPSGFSHLLIHGFLGQMSSFDSFVSKALKKSNNLHFLIIELPHHSLEIKNQKIDSLESASNALKMTLLALSQHFNIKNIFAYSMGGRLLLKTLLDELSLFKTAEHFYFSGVNPGLVSGEDFNQELKEREKRKLWDQSLFKDIKTKKDWHHFLTSWYQQPLFHTLASKNEVIEQLHHNLERQLDYLQRRNEQKPEQILKDYYLKALQVMSITQFENMWRKLSQLQAYRHQVTFLAGSDDQKYREINQEISQRFQLSHQLLPGSHAFHLESPDELLALLT